MTLQSGNEAKKVTVFTIGSLIKVSVCTNTNIPYPCTHTIPTILAGHFTLTPPLFTFKLGIWNRGF